jgi:ribonuclease E
VVHYHEPLPLFARHGVETFLASMFNPVVQLPSGGYIVIGVTEALVAIDVNSGRATKEGSIEQTASRPTSRPPTRCRASSACATSPGLIVIDFIDMEERKNNAAVEKRFKDKLKTDRARIQVGRISGFGLLEMSRQRLRPGMLESTTSLARTATAPAICAQTDSVALAILRQLDEEGVKGRTKER